MKKLLALVLAAIMVLSMAACASTTPPTTQPGTTTKPNTTNGTNGTEATQPPVTLPVDDRLAIDAIKDYFDAEDREAYTENSTKIYNEVLGEFYEYYTKALEQKDVATRWAMFAIAEAKLLESGVMVPTTSNGGNYAISRVAPKTVTGVLYGNDSYRYHQMVIATEFIKASEIAEMKAAWTEQKGTGTYEQWAKDYLTGKGYTLTDIYNYAYTSDPQTWDVLSTSRAADSEALINIYDGLVEYDIEETLKPALATEWGVSDDGLTWTFKIREGQVWVDNQGRKVADVTADDFVAGFQHMLDAAGGLEFLVDGLIEGASEYINGETSDFSTVGVKAVDTYTLTYTLTEPCAYFETMLGYGLFAPMSRSYYKSQGGQFGDEYDASADSYKYGKSPDTVAYCGPYVVTNATAESTIVFSANKSYWNADGINVHTINWKFLDSTDVMKQYNETIKGNYTGCGLNASALEQCKKDGLFDEYHYLSATDATSFMGFFVVERNQYANYNDASVAVSGMTMTDALRTNAAMKNASFRRALCAAFDRGTYNAQSKGEELKFANMINSYIPGNFVSLPEEVTVEINGTATTFAAGTYFGAITQAQLDADGVEFKVWDAENATSAGFDGWYNPEYAKKEMEVAIAELAKQGVEISAENPIYIDLPYMVNNTLYANRANALAKSLQDSLGGKVVMNLVPCQDAKEWYYAGYYPETGDTMNANFMDVSGWGPDYGDPKTYLDTMLPDYAGYMTKSLGIF